jgi:hypothetical protein
MQIFSVPIVVVQVTNGVAEVANNDRCSRSANGIKHLYPGGRVGARACRASQLFRFQPPAMSRLQRLVWGFAGVTCPGVTSIADILTNK